MEIVKDLGMLFEIDKDGSKHNRHYCLFKCPRCGQVVKLLHYRGIKRQMCAYCGKRNGTKHNMSRTKIYHVWQAMKDRCTNTNNPKYQNYGGKGIKVCDKWQTWEGFWEDIKDKYKEGLTIDRIDSNKDYCPENVQWIPLLENAIKHELYVKPVNQYEIIKTSEKTKKYKFIKQWNSATDAARDLGLNRQTIQMVCAKYPNRNSCGGYYWEYAREEDKV